MFEAAKSRAAVEVWKQLVPKNDVNATEEGKTCLSIYLFENDAVEPEVVRILLREHFDTKVLSEEENLKIAAEKKAVHYEQLKYMYN